MTGKMLAYFRQKEQGNETEHVYDSQCPFCSVQCKMQLIESRSGNRKRYKTIGKSNPTSHGRLCIKGMHAHQHALHKERLTQPMIKSNGQFVPISWTEALAYIKENITEIQQKYGYDAMSVYGSASITNEEAYLMGKFARVALKTKYIDYNGRLCMSAAASAATLTLGMDRGMTNGLQEIPEAECLILAGTNIGECQPTLMPYFEQAKKNGAFIIAIDPRETSTTKLANLHLQLKPGTDAALYNGILHVIFQEDLIDSEFLAKRAKGFDEVKKWVLSLELTEISDITGVSERDIRRAAIEFATPKTGMIFSARGVEQQTDGSISVRNLLNILLATGKVGKHACGYGAITGQSNGQGAREHGQKADQLPGYRSIENLEDRKFIANVWGISEEELPRKGVSAFEMIEKINTEEIKGMFLLCSNPVVSNPNAHFVKQALSKLNFLVAVDLFISETAKLADLILPSTSYLEDEGTMTNFEGRVTVREAAMKPIGEAKHDWQILCLIAKTLGAGRFFPFNNAEEIFNELRKASRGGKADYYGMSYSRLRENEGLLWPCPSVDHPGTSRLFEEGFAHDERRAKMVVVPNKPEVAKESVCSKYPLYLTTGRVMSHYLTGVQTRKSSSLEARNFESYMEIHPETAIRYNVKDQKLVKIESRRGSIIVRSKITKTIRKDTLFVPFHWDEGQNVNRLVADDLDPTCRMPSFKVSAVKLTLV
ncbi:assimilatory nitrate reductase catalytic subunit NasC [Alkalihalobacillus sp. 1P02AB]|uniref:assimilatory nitrate reductase catalytic subunit NasC n=1 Tax=Alkalihalobacillus sp. 1P02AB TaxID=3132260 RepID=UPI0039A56B5C